MQKIVIPTKDGNIHFCYIPESSHKKLLKESRTFGKVISDWYKKDFLREPDFTTREGVQQARRDIIKSVHEAYPIFGKPNVRIDRFGAIRLWIGNHIWSE